MRATQMDVDGQQAVVVSHVDITARKLAEEVILRSNAALEGEVRVRTGEMERAKMDAELYLDVMSHDLLNINQALLGYLEIALDQLGNEGRQIAKCLPGPWSSCKEALI